MMMSAITGEDIRNARARHGWTQYDLARLSGVSQGTISCIETGTTKAVPHIGKWAKIPIEMAIKRADDEAAQNQGAA